MRARLLVLLVASLLVAPGAAQERGRSSEGAPQVQGRPAKPGGRGKAAERPVPANPDDSAPAAGGQGAAPTPPTGRSGAPQGRSGAPAPKAPAPPPMTTPVPVPPEQVTLAAAQALFQSSDLDGDRQLDLKEAAVAGLGPRDCNAADSNGDRILAEPEFLAAYVTLLGRQQRRIAPDLQAAVTAPVAPTTTPEVASPVPPVSPVSPARSASPVVAAPAPSRPGTAQYELEHKIEEALRKNLGDQYVAHPQPTPPVETSVPAAASPSSSEEVTESAPVERSLEQRAAELREALELRLRESGAGPEEVAAARARLERQLAELAQAASDKPARGSRRDPTRTPDERDRELRENLDAKLLEDGATPEQAANARASLEARIAEMRAKAAERVAQEGAAEPAESRTFEQRAEELRANLELKLAETNALPAEAEAARARLERQLAEIDFLFLDVLDRANAGLLIHVIDDQMNGHLQWGGVGTATLVAFLEVKLGSADLVADKVELSRLGEVLDREDRLEHALQADVSSLGRLPGDLEKPVVGALLDLDEIGDVHNPTDLAKGPPGPEVGGQPRRHIDSFRDRS